MSNPLKTHTDNLHDGDFLLSPSLTNMLESAHGNGILMLEDYATGESRRYTPADLPGAVAYSSAHQVTIKGGHAVLDGLLVDFAGGLCARGAEATGSCPVGRRHFFVTLSCTH